LEFDSSELDAAKTDVLRNRNWFLASAGAQALGLTFSGSGAIGMITSGILLGVRKRNERLLQRSIRRRNEARFRWDLQSGAFVF
jgi:hypothetical protein